MKYFHHKKKLLKKFSRPIVVGQKGDGCLYNKYSGIVKTYLEPNQISTVGLFGENI